MNCRPYGSKSTIGFWMLVAIADAALLVAAAGPTVVLLSLAGVALVAGGAVATRRTRPRLPAVRLATHSPVARARLVTERSVRATEVGARRRA